jgi:hypothetical protein
MVECQVERSLNTTPSVSRQVSASQMISSSPSSNVPTREAIPATIPREAALNSAASSQYYEAATAAGFASLGFGREKTSIGVFIQRITSARQFDAHSDLVAVVLGVGTGWELSLLKKLRFSYVVGYEPAAAMLDRARELVISQGLDGVELYGHNELDSLKSKWKDRATLVLGTHVIPALQHRHILFHHFLDYREILSGGGIGLAITNNPQDQFSPHLTYSCHHFGKRVNDGDRIYTTLKDVPKNADDNHEFIVEDTHSGPMKQLERQ